MMIVDYLANKRAIIKPALQNWTQSLTSPTLAFEFDTLSFLEKFLVLGKLYRGGLVYLGYDLFVDHKSQTLKTDSQEYLALLKTAIAVELTNSAFLIHDDVMDQDDLRRGQQTFHCLMQEFALENGIKEAQHLGESLAICLGDLLIFEAFAQLAEAVDKLSNSAQILSFYSQEMALTTWGQIDDVFLAGLADGLNQSEILNIYALKTAHYSLVNPLLLGAMLAGATDADLKILKRFALNLGIVFQIKDDELNLFGRVEKIGKPAGSDIKENKKTIYRAFLLENACESDRQYLQTLFSSNTNITKAQLKKVQQLLAHYQIQSKVNRLSESFLAQAQQALQALKIEEDVQELLKSLIQLMLTRSK